MNEHKIILNHSKKNEWVIKYNGQDDLTFYDFNEALVSLGILAKEVSRVFGVTVRVNIFNLEKKLIKESFLFPENFHLKHADFLSKPFFKLN